MSEVTPTTDVLKFYAEKKAAISNTRMGLWLSLLHVVKVKCLQLPEVA